MVVGPLGSPGRGPVLTQVKVEAIWTILIDVGSLGNRGVAVDGHGSLEGGCETVHNCLGFVRRYLQYYDVRER